MVVAISSLYCARVLSARLGVDLDKDLETFEAFEARYIVSTCSFTQDMIPDAYLLVHFLFWRTSDRGFLSGDAHVICCMLV